MELMENPVTVSTGVTYERKNIEKWLYTYKKATCPATMQPLHSFDLTPNHTLKRLIDAWMDQQHQQQHSPISAVSSADHDNLVSLLATLQSTPFKVTTLKKLQSIVLANLSIQEDLVRSGGVQFLAQIMSQVNSEGADFSAFRACEESVALLHHLPLSDKASAELLSRPDCLNPMMTVLQRGNAEARLHAMTVLQKLSAVSRDWMQLAVDREELDVIKSLLELLSDEISTTTQLTSCSLDVLIEIVSASKKNRHKAIEAGAVCVLIELLPDSNRHKCEKILLLIQKLCECPEGRLAFTDHGLGVAAVSKKVLRVSDLATKLGVKILWLVCSFMPKEPVIGDMMSFGAVRKLIGLLHVEGWSSTKEKAVKMLKMHGGVWRQYGCFPSELREYLKLLHH